MSLPALFVGAVLLALLSPAAFAAKCTVEAIGGANFGAYEVFSAAPNTSGVATLSVDCQGSIGIVELSQGRSHNYAVRQLRSGSNTLDYNLYTSAARSMVWGDGSGVSSTMTAAKNQTTLLTVFGQIPAGQDVAVGSYSDNITVTVNF